MNYSNPRMHAVIENWPNGFREKVTATFNIEQTPKGERAVRTTTGKARKMTFSTKQRIVDGDDGKTYIASWHEHGSIIIFDGLLKYSLEHAMRGNPRYAELLPLFESSKEQQEKLGFTPSSEKII
jgi:hypothetical protein